VTVFSAWIKLISPNQTTLRLPKMLFNKNAVPRKFRSEV